MRCGMRTRRPAASPYPHATVGLIEQHEKPEETMSLMSEEIQGFLFTALELVVALWAVAAFIVDVIQTNQAICHN